MHLEHKKIPDGNIQISIFSHFYQLHVLFFKKASKRFIAEDATVRAPTHLG